jgi:hypothetical protein
MVIKRSKLKQKSPMHISAMGFLRDIHRRSKKILLIDSPHTQILIASFMPTFIVPIKGLFYVGNNIK